MRVAQISRLPVALYMMSRLGVRSLLPVILRVGRDMDWPIASLFAIAADWFCLAETILRRLGYDDGLGQFEENLARQVLISLKENEKILLDVVPYFLYALCTVEANRA